MNLPSRRPAPPKDNSTFQTIVPVTSAPDDAASTPSLPPSTEKNATNLVAWALLAAIGLLAALVAWRAQSLGGSLSAARLSGAGGALAAGAALLLGATRNANASQTRAMMILGGALIVRAAWEMSGFVVQNAAKSSGSKVFADALLFLGAPLLALAILWWNSQDTASSNALDAAEIATSRRARLLWMLDAIIIGGALMALWWWTMRVPLMLGNGPAGRAQSGTGLPGLWLLFWSGSALAATIFRAAPFLRGGAGAKRKLLSAGLGVMALLLWWLSDARFLGASTRGAISMLDVVLRWSAPLLLGASVLLAMRNSGTRDATSSASTWNGRGANLNAGQAREVMILALPCVVLLAMAWRLGVPNLRAAVFGATSQALWWGPMLLVLVVARRALSGRTSAGGGSGEMQQQIAILKQSLDQRTHQLSTLHSVTADLSNTFNCEHILSTAIERAVAALGAEAGAIWLNIDAEALSEAPSEHERTENIASGNETLTRTTPTATFVWRELERSGEERRSLDSLRANATFRIGGSGGSGAGPAVLEKRWSMVLARGHEQEAPRRALADLHRALESPGGLDRFEALTRGSTLGEDEQIERHQNSITIENAPHGSVNTLPGLSPKKPRPPAKPSAAVLNALRNAHVAPIRSKGEVLGALGVVREGRELDAAERSLIAALALEIGAALQNVQLYQETSRLADRDSLTDLLNHRAIQGQLNAVLNRAIRSETELAVVMMDLNNFKFFNDTYGHPEGDRVLRIVSTCLREACRGSDIVGRFGGDEFIALLVDTDTEGALHACRRIAARVEEEGYQQRGDQRRIPITLSFGAAIFPHDGNTALELLAAADANLYEAKRGGAPMMVKRNQSEETQELRKLKSVSSGGSFGVLDALVTAIDNKDRYTRRHSEDVTHWASLMARQMEFSSETQRAVRIAGLLHDVGKIAVPDSVLRKPGRLNDDEFQIMQQHPLFGALIVKDVPNLPEVLGGIKHHHERFDGRGYPEKLRGDDIPLLGRLLAVPDCFSAMTTDRPYRKALSWTEALDEIEKGKGTQFDPEMADAFLEVMAQIITDQNAQSLDPNRESVLQFSGNESAEERTETDVSGSAATQVARKMAETDAPIATPDSDDAQFLPRSVADAEVK